MAALQIEIHDIKMKNGDRETQGFPICGGCQVGVSGYPQPSGQIVFHCPTHGVLQTFDSEAAINVWLAAKIKEVMVKAGEPIADAAEGLAFSAPDTKN